eukprot:1159145-Pelagomonas_calceolata.AAC.29
MGWGQAAACKHALTAQTHGGKALTTPAQQAQRRGWGGGELLLAKNTHMEGRIRPLLHSKLSGKDRGGVAEVLCAKMQEGLRGMGLQPLPRDWQMGEERKEGEGRCMHRARTAHACQQRRREPWDLA